MIPITLLFSKSPYYKYDMKYDFFDDPDHPLHDADKNKSDGKTESENNVNDENMENSSDKNNNNQNNDDDENKKAS